MSEFIGFEATCNRCNKQVPLDRKPVFNLPGYTFQLHGKCHGIHVVGNWSDDDVIRSPFAHPSLPLAKWLRSAWDNAK